MRSNRPARRSLLKPIAGRCKAALLAIGCLNGHSAFAQSGTTLWKLGLNAPHLQWAPASGRQRQQVVVPLAVGLEMGIACHTTLYSQAEYDWQIGRACGRGRNSAASSFSLALGGRYYYQPLDSLSPRQAGLFTGHYVAAELHTDFARAATRRRNAVATQISPSVVLLWGTQFRISRHLLGDFNFGGGMQHLSYPLAQTGGELPARWAAVGQFNVLLYLLKPAKPQASNAKKAAP